MECQLFVLENCCTDLEPDANEFAMTRLLPCIATVCTADDFIAVSSDKRRH